MNKNNNDTCTTKKKSKGTNANRFLYIYWFISLIGFDRKPTKLDVRLIFNFNRTTTKSN